LATAEIAQRREGRQRAAVPTTDFRDIPVRIAFCRGSRLADALMAGRRLSQEEMEYYRAPYKDPISRKPLFM
jgi:hypothetical protein